MRECIQLLQPERRLRGLHLQPLAWGLHCLVVTRLVELLRIAKLFVGPELQVLTSTVVLRTWLDGITNLNRGSPTLGWAFPREWI